MKQGQGCSSTIKLNGDNTTYHARKFCNKVLGTVELTPDASTATLERRAHNPRVSSIAGGDDHERAENQKRSRGARVGASWRAATQQFSTCGLSGARVDAIATAADSNERMLYYYFQSKGGLSVAVLETMYAEFARHEVSLDPRGTAACRRDTNACAFIYVGSIGPIGRPSREAASELGSLRGP